MLLVSFLLVIVATIFLLSGLFLTKDLALIFISIACSALAGIVLVVAVMRSRPRPDAVPAADGGGLTPVAGQRGAGRAPGRRRPSGRRPAGGRSGVPDPRLRLAGGGRGPAAARRPRTGRTGDGAPAGGLEPGPPLDPGPGRRPARGGGRRRHLRTRLGPGSARVRRVGAGAPGRTTTTSPRSSPTTPTGRRPATPIGRRPTSPSIPAPTTATSPSGGPRGVGGCPPNHSPSTVTTISG